MFHPNSFHKGALVALLLPSLALASWPFAPAQQAQQRVPLQPAPTAPVAPGTTVDATAIPSFVRVPAGTIVAYAGENPPAGYLLCDGSEVLRDDYPVLFAAIGTGWGFATTFTFTLPDLRGRFLRGVDGGAGNDPDRLSRVAINPGSHVGDEVGSLQGDGRRGFSGTFPGTTSTNGDHSHSISTNQDDFDECCTGISWANDGGPSGVHKSTNTAGAHSHTTSTTVTFNGESESRPKNANVNFIIKI